MRVEKLQFETQRVGRMSGFIALSDKVSVKLDATLSDNGAKNAPHPTYGLSVEAIYAFPIRPSNV